MPSIANQPPLLAEIVDEQRSLFAEAPLTAKLPARELLTGTVAMKGVQSPSLYREFPAKVLDSPKLDTVTVLIDIPTVADLVEEFAGPRYLSPEDVTRLYVGAGIASLLVLHSYTPSRPKRMRRFSEALTDPQGLYARTMQSAVFDSAEADNSARAIAVDGHTQTARVNALRLRGGMFIEVQPEPKAVRKRVEATFQEALEACFDNRGSYIETATSLSACQADAEKNHTNALEYLMGLSFPMQREEVAGMLKILS